MKSSEKRIEKVDQLFKNKLDDHTLAPPENAWARVEAGFSKKNKRWLGVTTTVMVWRVAAAVLLMGALLSVFYWARTGSGTEKVLAKKIPLETEPKKDTTQALTGDKNNAEAPLKKNKIKQTIAPNQFAHKESSDKKEVAPDEQPSQSRKNMIDIEKELAQNYSVKLNSDSNPAVNKEEKIMVEATPRAKVASIQQKPIKLEFTLEALPSEETVATTTEEKSTGIKKVLNLAREVKQGEGLSSLRDKKDELLAHNFLTKRERNQ